MTYFLGMSTHNMTTEMWTVLRETRERPIYFDGLNRDHHRHLYNAARDLDDAGLVELDGSGNHPSAYPTDAGRRFYAELGPEYDAR